MSQPTFTVHRRKIQTPFGLVGGDENALSIALGFTLRHCPELLRMILRGIGVSRWHTKWGEMMEVHAQRHRHDGITDLEIHIPGRLMLVIEAKIGMSLPSLAQCQRYLNRFTERPSPRELLVLLTQSDPADVTARYCDRDERLKMRLRSLRWTDLLAMCTELRRTLGPASDAMVWVKAFHHFLDKEFHMKCYTEEVWIVSANTQPLWPNGLSFYDTHVNVEQPIYYRTDSHKKRPLYIALRYDRAVRHIQRVLAIEYETAPIRYVPALKELEEKWPSQPHTIWRLDRPVELSHSIRSGDRSIRSRKCSCDLDVLLSSKTVREIELRMKERRLNGTGIEATA
jgi:hypothetical protein